jgi:hypothetical protein
MANKGAAAFAGGLISGYLAGKKMKAEDEERQARKEEREARKAEREKRGRDDDEIRAVMSGNPGDRKNSSILSVGGPDMGDIIQGVPPPSPVEVIKKVGTNIYSDSAAADRTAEMENFATGADEGQAAKVEPSAAFKVKGVGVFDDTAQAINAAQQAGEDARLAVAREGVDKPVQKGLDRQAADIYHQRKAPQVIDTYLRQGRIEEAKRYRDFIDSEAGRGYTEKWARGVRKLAIGDYQGALGDWERMYNDQLFDDGHTVKLTPLEDGKQVQADFFDKSGKPRHSVTQPISLFASQAGMALAPEKLVEFRAQQQAKREAEAAALDKSLQLEGMRQQGQEAREDRRDERFQMRLDQQSQQFERRLQAERERRDNPKPLTATQQRTNDAIDAARQQIAGLSQPDILRKTQSSMASGRANPDFDPQLARTVRLANSRKFGDDTEHDKFSAGKADENAAANARAEIASRFRSDKTMANRTLGKETPDGIEVLEKGRLVGYYR